MSYQWKTTPAGKQKLCLDLLESRTAGLEISRRRLIAAMRLARQHGCSFIDIGAKVGISAETASKWIKEG